MVKGKRLPLPQRFHHSQDHAQRVWPQRIQSQPMAETICRGRQAGKGWNEAYGDISNG